MKGNSFGRIFRITTWGESHGAANGVVVDGCPSGIPLTQEDFQKDMNRRRGGQNAYSTTRKETDEVHIQSGVFQGKTTGTPISLVIKNQNTHSQDYTQFEHTPRPGHGDFTTQKKHSHRDFRGGGRLSARETVARVAGATIAKKILSRKNIEILAFVSRIGEMQVPRKEIPFHETRELTQDLWPRIDAHRKNNKLCLPIDNIQPFEELLIRTREEKNSLGGAVECWVQGLPPGLGEPIFDKASALLAHAMMTLPATVGVQLGGGQKMSYRPGSMIRDPIVKSKTGLLKIDGNRHGGLLGGMTTGNPLWLSVDFHAPTSIPQPIASTNMQTGEETIISVQGRHDLFPLPRAVPIVEAMAALVLVDLLALHESNLP